MKLFLIAVVAGMAGTCSLQHACADDDAAQREQIVTRLEAMLREAGELEEAGRADEAARLRDEAAELKRDLGVGRDRERPPHVEEGLQRLEHVHAAVEHLHAAGLHDLAEATAQRAAEMERDLHRAVEEREHAEREKQERAERMERVHPAEHPPELAEIHELVAALREEVEALRREVGELRERSQ